MLRTPCICNGLATHGPAHSLASCCKQRIGAFCHQNCRFLATYIPAHPAKPVPMVHASAYVPPRSGRVVKTGVYPGVNLPRRIPWPVRRPSLCIRLWNHIAVRSRPRLTHRIRFAFAPRTVGSRRSRAQGWPSIRLAFAVRFHRPSYAFALHSPR